jgi:hypothetical protein
MGKDEENNKICRPKFQSSSDVVVVPTLAPRQGTTQTGKGVNDNYILEKA